MKDFCSCTRKSILLSRLGVFIAPNSFFLLSATLEPVTTNPSGQLLPPKALHSCCAADTLPAPRMQPPQRLRLHELSQPARAEEIGKGKETHEGTEGRQEEPQQRFEHGGQQQDQQQGRQRHEKQYGVGAERLLHQRCAIALAAPELHRHVLAHEHDINMGWFQWFRVCLLGVLGLYAKGFGCEHKVHLIAGRQRKGTVAAFQTCSAKKKRAQQQLQRPSNPPPRVQRRCCCALRGRRGGRGWGGGGWVGARAPPEEERGYNADGEGGCDLNGAGIHA